MFFKLCILNFHISNSHIQYFVYIYTRRLKFKNNLSNIMHYRINNNVRKLHLKSSLFIVIIQFVNRLETLCIYLCIFVNNILF